jgi:predicted ATPase
VLVDDVTRRASEAAIAYEDAGEHQLKGREQPVRAWVALRVVAGVGGARRSVGLEAPLVGRESELQTIIDVAEDSAAQATARLVTVTGEAGTGKSRLLWEFFKHVDGIQDVRWWHQGRCLSYGEGVAYWALAEMVRARAGVSEEDDAEGERAKLGAVIERFVSDERERRLVRPRLAQLLGLEQRAAGEAADLFSGWRLFFERMAQSNPVILAFEDLQWADSGLLDFIDYLLEWSADYPIFILALGRPELEERRPGWGTAIRLHGLSEESMRGLLEGLVPGLPGDLTARILERAEGVPLYAVETVRMLLDRGVLAQEGSRYVVSGPVEDLDVPETLQALVAARLDNLATAERTLLQDAAVLGTSFSASALAAVSERREAEVRQALDGLVAKQVLGRDDDRRSSEPGQYHFLQALLRNVSLSTLSRRERKARHLAAARHLEEAWGAEAGEIAEVLASHYLDAVAAEPHAADAAEIRRRARETLSAAGARAVSLALGAEARALYERAAGLAESEAERASLLADAGAAAARSDREAGSRLLEESIALLDAAGESEQAALTRLRLADVLIGLNHLERAKQLTLEGEAALRDPGQRAEAAALRGKVAFMQGDFQLTREQSELALSIADPRRLYPVIAEAAMNKAIALQCENRMNEAGALMTMALDVALSADLPEAALRAYYNLAEFRSLQGEMTEAGGLIERGLELARERGNRAWERDLLAQRGVVDLLRGEWDELLALTESLAAQASGSSHRLAMALLPPILAARGQAAALRSWLEEPRAPSEWQELVILETLGEATALAALGEADAAVARLESVAERLAFNSTSVALYLADAIQILLAAGRRDLVARLTELVGVAAPLIAPQRLQARAMLHVDAGEVEAAEAAFREALAGLRRIETPFMLGRCLYHLGALLAGQDRGEEAAPLLREAEELFERLGATVWLERLAALAPQVAA